MIIEGVAEFIIDGLAHKELPHNFYIHIHIEFIKQRLGYSIFYHRPASEIIIAPKVLGNLFHFVIENTPLKILVKIFTHFAFLYALILLYTQVR